MSKRAQWESNNEIQRIREYLRIPTVSSNEPRTDYGRYLTTKTLR